MSTAAFLKISSQQRPLHKTETKLL